MNIGAVGGFIYYDRKIEKWRNRIWGKLFSLGHIKFKTPIRHK